MVSRKLRYGVRSQILLNIFFQVSALLNGGSVEDSCKAAQGAGDHRTALLLAQVGGGTNASKLAMQQLDSWTQVKTNQHITEKRRALYSLAAGT